MENSNIEWLERLSKAVESAKSSHVRVSRGKLLKVCLIARMAIRMLEAIDKGDNKQARVQLNALVEILHLQIIEAGIRKVDVRED
jgi:hypothetical protein